MIHVLPPHPARVHDGAEAVRAPPARARGARPWPASGPAPGRARGRIRPARRRAPWGSSGNAPARPAGCRGRRGSRRPRRPSCDGISPATILQKMQSSLLHHDSFLRGLFLDSRAALAPLELREHLRHRRCLPPEQHQAVEPEIGGLVDDAGALARLRGDHRLGGLLADLLEDGVESLGIELRHVGRRGIGAARAPRSPPPAAPGSPCQPPSRKPPGSRQHGVGRAPARRAAARLAAG